MDALRISKHFQQILASERKKGSSSIDRIKTLEEVVDYINNADAPQEGDRISIKEIFQKNYVAFKGTRYVFTKSQDIELDGLIVQIKQEMAENTEDYAEITVAQFFELFMNNMDEFWKKHQFTTWGFNKQFWKILSQVKSNKTTPSGSKYGSGKSKPSYSSVMNH